MKRQFEALRRLTQRNLIEFLRGELDLAYTFEELAQTCYRRGDSEGAAKCLHHAQIGLTAVRYFMGRITDQTTQARVDKMAEELEGMISKSHGKTGKATGR